MKISKEEFRKNILLLADQINLKTSYEEMLNSYFGIPKVCQDLIYDLFVNDYNNSNHLSDDGFEAYYHLKNYCKELKEKGFVEFKN